MSLVSSGGPQSDPRRCDRTIFQQVSLSDCEIQKLSRHFSSHLESLEDGLVALMGHKATVSHGALPCFASVCEAESPYLTKAIDNILLVTQTSLKKGIIDQHAVAQQAVINADQAVMTCSSAELVKRIEEMTLLPRSWSAAKGVEGVARRARCLGGQKQGRPRVSPVLNSRGSSE